MTFGEKIKNARLEKHLTQEQLGKLVGVGKAAIAKYEKGVVVNIKRSKIQSLAKALDLKGSDLIETDPIPNGANFSGYTQLFKVSKEANDISIAYDKATKKEKELVRMVLKEYLP